MFNEATLHKYPALVHAFTGIPAEEFWDMLEKNGGFRFYEPLEK